MASQQTTHKKSSGLAWILPLSISLFSLWFVLRTVDLAEVRQAFSKLPVWGVMALMAVFSLGQVLRSSAWKAMLGPNFDLKTAFFGMNAGYLLNNILPFRIGEVGRSLLLTGQGRNKGPFMQVFASIITERVLDVFIAATVFLISLTQISASNTIRTIALGVFALMLAGMVVLGIASRREVETTRWLESVLPKGKLFQELLLPKIGSFLKGFGVLSDKRRFISAFGLLAASWVTAFMEAALLQHLILPEGKLWWGAFIVSAAAFGMALPSAPAGIGVYEAATVSAYSLLGVGQSPALAIAVVLHLMQIIVSSVLGAIGVGVLGDNLSSLIKRTTRQKEEMEHQA